jgi:hypothetical protein
MVGDNIRYSSSNGTENRDSFEALMEPTEKSNRKLS